MFDIRRNSSFYENKIQPFDQTKGLENIIFIPYIKIQQTFECLSVFGSDVIILMYCTNIFFKVINCIL